MNDILNHFSPQDSSFLSRRSGAVRGAESRTGSTVCTATPGRIWLLIQFYYYFNNCTSSVDRESLLCVCPAHLLGCGKCVSSCVLYSSVGGHPREWNGGVELSHDTRIFFSTHFFKYALFLTHNCVLKQQDDSQKHEHPPAEMTPAPLMQQVRACFRLYVVYLTV